MTVLKHIPRVVSPRLLYTLARMGHGDELVLADANFPAASVASHCPGGLVRADCDIPVLLHAILQLMPLDYVGRPAAVMAVAPADAAEGMKTPVWDTYRHIITDAAGQGAGEFEEVERFAFYDRAKTAFGVVATTEGALYGNLILRKGVLPPEADTTAGAGGSALPWTART